MFEQQIKIMIYFGCFVQNLPRKPNTQIARLKNGLKNSISVGQNHLKSLGE